MAERSEQRTAGSVRTMGSPLADAEAVPLSPHVIRRRSRWAGSSPTTPVDCRGNRYATPPGLFVSILTMCQRLGSPMIEIVAPSRPDITGTRDCCSRRARCARQSGTSSFAVAVCASCGLGLTRVKQSCARGILRCTSRARPAPNQAGRDKHADLPHPLPALSTDHYGRFFRPQNISMPRHSIH